MPCFDASLGVVLLDWVLGVGIQLTVGGDKVSLGKACTPSSTGVPWLSHRYHTCT